MDVLMSRSHGCERATMYKDVLMSPEDTTARKQDDSMDGEGRECLEHVLEVE